MLGVGATYPCCVVDVELQRTKCLSELGQIRRAPLASLQMAEQQLSAFKYCYKVLQCVAAVEAGQPAYGLEKIILGLAYKV